MIVSRFTWSSTSVNVGVRSGAYPSRRMLSEYLPGSVAVSVNSPDAVVCGVGREAARREQEDACVADWLAVFGEQHPFHALRGEWRGAQADRSGKSNGTDRGC
jgi:hypothetical protein